MRVSNKSIIVTGAGNGIGEGIAKRLAAEGGKVIINDINEAGGQRVVAEITAAGGTAAFFKADVTKSAEVKAMVDEAVRPRPPSPCNRPPVPKYQPNRLIRCLSQTHLPQPFGLSLSKPGRSLRAALRQAQGERVYRRYVANQAKSASSA